MKESSLSNIFYVFIGGGAGSVVRFGISLLITNVSKTVFPVATLCSNVLSCLVLGLALYLAGEKLSVQAPLRLLLITGFCGGFSTFSAFSYETVELIKGGNTLFAVINILISVTSCIGIIYFFTRSTT